MHRKPVCRAAAVALVVAAAITTAVASASEGVGTAARGGAVASAAGGTLRAPASCNVVRPVPTIPVSKPKKSYKIVNLLAHLGDSFSDGAEYGATQEAKRLGASIKSLQAGGYQAPQTQIAQIQSAITQHANAILIWATDENAVVPYIKQALKAGIVVIGYVQVPATKVTAYAQSDDENEAFQQTKCLVEAAGGKGQFAAVFGVAGSTYEANIQKGFEKAVKSFPKAQIVAENTIPDTDPAKTQTIVQNDIQRYPNLKGVFGTVMTMADGATEAIAAAHDTGKIGVAASNIDSPKAGTLLDKGVYTVISDQRAVTYGKVVVDLAIACLEGKKLSVSQRHLLMTPNLYTNGSTLTKNLATALAPGS